MIDLFSDAPIGNPKAAGIDNARKTVPAENQAA